MDDSCSPTNGAKKFGNLFLKLFGTDSDDVTEEATTEAETTEAK